MIHHDNVRTDPRLAGGVKRYHTWPTLTTQTVAEHSWNVARILVAIYPEATGTLLQAAMFHDIGEIGPGDPPFPTKKNNPDLKSVYDRLEAETIQTMEDKWDVTLGRFDLYSAEKKVLKLADMIEMWEFGLYEVNLGNRFAEGVAIVTYEWLSKEVNEMHPDSTLRKRVYDYMCKRSKLWRTE